MVGAHFSKEAAMRDHRAAIKHQTRNQLEKEKLKWKSNLDPQRKKTVRK